MEEEITPNEKPETPTINEQTNLTPTDDSLTPPDDVTNFLVDGVTDDRTLMGTMFHYVFGNVDVTVFIVSIMILTTVLIIATDFMRWKGRE
ncbi:hypothetical protein ACQQ6W_23295 [Lysinibacillus fusiformis]